MWLLARGDTFARLSSEGVRLHTNGASSAPAVTVVDSPAVIPEGDVVYLVVLADQVDAAVPILAQIHAPVDVVPDMTAWPATHTVFIAGVSAAILEAGGSEALGNDRARTTRMVLSVRDGFAALRRDGTAPTPTPLRLIFTLVPRAVSVPYWQRQMRGDLGRLSLSPHILATRDSELPHLAPAARRITRNSARLDCALTAAGLPQEPS